MLYFASLPSLHPVCKAVVPCTSKQQLCCGSGETRDPKNLMLASPFPPGTQQTAQPSCICRVLGVCFKEKRGKRDIFVLSPHSPWRGFCWGAPLKMCVCARLWDANCSASQPVLEGIILKQGWKSPELSAFHTDTGCQGSCFMKQAGIMGLHYPEVGWKPVLHAVNPFIALRSRAHACCF